MCCTFTLTQGDIDYQGTITSHLPCLGMPNCFIIRTLFLFLSYCTALMYLVNQDNRQVISIGSSIGAVFLVFTFILIVVILMVVFCRKKKITGKLFISIQLVVDNSLSYRI